MSILLSFIVFVIANAASGIGILLLVCTVIYVILQTAVLGAILLTGYPGGATATPGPRRC